MFKTRIFLLVDLQTLLLESRKKNQKFYFSYFYLPTLNIICFIKKIELLSVFFESDTAKSDGPVQIFRKMMKYLKI